MQTEQTLKTPDNFIIYGTLNQPETKTDKLIIFVHGITGNQHEHQYYNAVPFFNKHGFATFRFDFYTREAGARKLTESSIKTHISDLETVISNFHKQFSEIYLVGHSLGASIIALADHKIAKKLVLWDPTFGFTSIADKGITFLEELDLYLCDWQMQILLSKAFVEQWQKITISEQIQSLHMPTKIIFAGDEVKLPAWKQHFSELSSEHTAAIIPNATHRFTEQNVLENLYAETLAWII